MIRGSRPLQVGDLVKFRTWHDSDNDWVILDDAGVWSVIAIETFTQPADDFYQVRDGFNNSMVTVLGPIGIVEVLSGYLIRCDEQND